MSPKELTVRAWEEDDIQSYCNAHVYDLLVMQKEDDDDGYSIKFKGTLYRLMSCHKDSVEKVKRMYINTY
jgi:hypothetical protein